MIHGNLLVLLSDIDGLFDRDPHRFPDARPIPLVERLDETILALGDAPGSSLGSGGMATKLKAAQIATAAGCPMVIANGSNPDILYDIAAGKAVGTRLLAEKETRV